MSDHEHKWNLYITDWGEALEIACECNEGLTVEQAEAMLNEHPKLKRENEKLQKFVDEGMVIALSFPGLQEKLYALLPDTQEKE